MTITRVAAVTALTFAAFFGAGLVDGIASADPAPGRLGPYAALAACEREGNAGIENGEWADYECEGAPGAWTIVAR
ncbi:hypothetical protein DFR70_102164 [Nocardia tenerifensis]|uniref:Uncharacterized protein n=1 Tax=Nocardia tenerifensis TaxID=228006 RepID=A0A318K6G5_9NOCA|nr:hypothetical protein [Nocardia tenerifensis]PXX68483.1 hypothetical protein DFR70_102164 [Nocardia tenerifensis]